MLSRGFGLELVSGRNDQNLPSSTCLFSAILLKCLRLFSVYLIRQFLNSDAVWGWLSCYGCLVGKVFKEREFFRIRKFITDNSI
jgi:hypothetical protein